MTEKMERQRAEDDKIKQQLNVTINELRQRILVLEAQVLELNGRLEVLIDIKSQFDIQIRANRECQQQRDELRHELESAEEMIQELEAKFVASRQEALAILKELRNREALCSDYLEQITNLQNYIIDLKSRIAVYIPVKNDKIDKKIAEYINNYPERQKLKIMFMRESEGVYQFGSKRVMVKIDNDKINIRVGGGFLSIDEFLDQYTPEELQKLERRDPMTKFNQKTMVSKSLQGHMVRDNSPSSPNKRGRGI